MSIKSGAVKLQLNNKKYSTWSWWIFCGQTDLYLITPVSCCAEGILRFSWFFTALWSCGSTMDVLLQGAIYLASAIYVQYTYGVDHVEFPLGMLCSSIISAWCEAILTSMESKILFPLLVTRNENHNESTITISLKWKRLYEKTVHRPQPQALHLQGLRWCCYKPQKSYCRPRTHCIKNEGLQLPPWLRIVSEHLKYSPRTFLRQNVASKQARNLTSLRILLLQQRALLVAAIIIGSESRGEAKGQHVWKNSGKSPQWNWESWAA